MIVSELQSALEPYVERVAYLDRPVKGEATMGMLLHVCDESLGIVVRTLNELYALETAGSP